MGITSISGIVRLARNKSSQAEFAKFLGVKQTSISRYESGKASPPRAALEKCMRLVHTNEKPPSADDLANKIKITLSDDRYGHVRQALASIIDNLVISH
ncbi:MAG: helix-turn-helix domain-containing protein [Methylotenera sp.]|nr:helix-turn-helix domain-containing protein [Methylotenera sp.]MDP3061435.1 helix-turn-helix domain-containing protein [Methylotenera sp.]